VNDIHQQGTEGSRIFIPPYMDPIEPNVDPILIAGVNQMGMAMAWRMTVEGKTGIAVNASYDAWTPARAYQHYHGGIRILTETASARIATPIDVPFDSLGESRGYDARVSSWNFLAPWRGGRWRLADIVDYQTSATWALLAEAARDHRTWLESFATLSERAVAGKRAAGRETWPAAYVIPPAQADTAAVATLLRILQRGGVEVRRAPQPIGVDGTRIGAGSYVVPLDQPYGAFAKALLEPQDYPDLREYPGGPPKRPYDVTAHTLPLLMGVTAVAVDTLPVSSSAPLPMLPEPRLTAPGLSDRTTRRIALYRSHVPSMDEGWTRWILERYRIRYTSITDRDVAAGNLARHFDAIILPDQSPRALTRGLGAPYPDSLRGGLGDAGANALARFVRDGGTLVAFNEASDYAIEALDLPVRDAVAGVSSREFYAPGSILRIALDTTHWMARGLTSSSVAWFEEGPAFTITDTTRARAVASYPASDSPLLSGWLLGGDRLAGSAAIVDVREGKGHVILFGFRPQYRAQSLATYPLIWGALRGK
jgi:hypothetical protein